MPNHFVENVNCSDFSIYGTTTNHTPYYVPDNSVPMDGAVRTNKGGLEYYDSSIKDWLPLPGTEVRLELGPIARTVLDWAHEKMIEEQKLEELVKKYPSLKAAKENYEIVKAMVEHG
jgi:hypothetical protein